MENFNSNNNKSSPKQAETIVNAITESESSILREFILSKLPSEGSLELQYRPDEWDSAGIVQKIQDLGREYIQRTHVVSNQLEPRKFKLYNIVDASELGEEYSEYNKNGEILYLITATVSTSDSCSGGSTIYTETGKVVDLSSGTNITIHRCESLNSWKIMPVRSGNRLDLSILIQENDRQISYDYPIDQITRELPSF